MLVFGKAQWYNTCWTWRKCSFFLSFFEHTVQRRQDSRKIGICDGGSGPGRDSRECLDGGKFRKEFFLITNELIILSAMSNAIILKYFRISCVFSNIFVNNEGIYACNIKQIEEKTWVKSKFWSSVELICRLELIHRVNTAHIIMWFRYWLLVDS